jgi:hypothetical protein
VTDPELVAKKLAVVEDVLRNHLGDLLAFVAAVRAS